MTTMSTIQQITHQGRLAAIVLAGQAIIDDTLPVDQQRHVQAMCLYALEISAGDRARPYTDASAEAYARQALSRP
jgi:hypothetical protein